MKRRKVVSSERTLLGWSRLYSATLSCGHVVTVQMMNNAPPKTAQCRQCEVAKP